jgi:hypothetical protein
MNAQELFLKNYQNQGDCQQLSSFVKTIEKEFRKTGQVKIIRYYPWAVVERIFRMQGGKIDVVNWALKVELTGRDLAPNQNGELVMSETKSNALFIHLKATWQGVEENEYYPIFDNQNAKIIKLPDALDLNTAKQRGMVRLIARISGIGLEIFEQQEGQFEEDKEAQSQIKVSSKKSNDVPNVEANSVFETIIGAPKPQTKVETWSPNQKPTPKEVETPKTEVEFGSDTQEYADLLLEIRKVIREKSVQAQAKAFVIGKGKELLSQLSYSELLQLKSSL